MIECSVPGPTGSWDRPAVPDFVPDDWATLMTGSR
jgi:hypothetical protein